MAVVVVSLVVTVVDCDVAVVAGAVAVAAFPEQPSGRKLWSQASCLLISSIQPIIMLLQLIP